MGVIPDLIPVLEPSLDLRVTYVDKPVKKLSPRTLLKGHFSAVEPGVFLEPAQVCFSANT